MDVPVSFQDGSEADLMEIISDDKDNYEPIDLSDFKESMLKHLLPREKHLIEMTVISGMKQGDAGRQLGYSQSVVSRYVKQGIEKIRENYWRCCG